ncbi:SH3 domain-containing protein [Pedobacter sp. ASV1-7]|uniref:SH3 domain-containing protein n=1 Tax=Pedobacter sp. ASV1-7 TaxID=3145237 RepID=UPI0032E8D5A2
MKKILALLFILCIAQILYANEMYRVNTERLNVRESPSASGLTIGYLDVNTLVEALDTTNSSWYKIKVNNGIGYVSSHYLVKKATIEPTSELTNYDLKVIGIGGFSIILIVFLYYLFQNKTRKYALTLLLTTSVGVGIFYSYKALIMKPSISGIYVNTKGGIYRSFDFKGGSTVLVKDGIIGLDFAVGYIVDGNIIRITSNTGDLLLNIKDENTLIGEGFSTGIYKKEN